MLTQVPKREKLFQFDYASDSDEEQPGHLAARDIIIPPPNVNLQKQNQSLQNNQSSLQNNHIQQIQVVKLERSYVTERPLRNCRNQPMRRNASIKVKKVEQNIPTPRGVSSRSVSKLVNIFQEAQQMQAKTSGQFAVHDQFPNGKIASLDATVSTNFSNSKKLEIVRKAQESPILKISNFVKTENKNKHDLKKQVKFTSHSTFKEIIANKSSRSQNPTINQLLDRKLSDKTQPRPESAVMTKKGMKTLVKVEEVENMDKFVYKNLSLANILIARMKRLSWGLNWLWPQFHLRDERSGLHILSAKKKAVNATSNYYISRGQKQIDVQNDKYAGKVRGNFVGSCFNIFGRGVNPETVQAKERTVENVRKIQASIAYESQFGNSNPKSIRVYVIKPQYSYYDLEGTSLKAQEKSLDKLYEIGQNKAKIHLMVNRKATYNRKLNRFVLNFDGRVKLPSTKNFILQDFETKREVMMFGKVDVDDYVMHISSPLTPLVALGVVLAELDTKIICD